jgi:putative heme-binding domain-containing protein
LSFDVKQALPADLRPAIVGRLDDPAREVREAAVLAVVAMRMTEAVPRLLAMAGKPGSPEHDSAVAALCQLPDPRAVAIYLETIGSRNPQLRRAGESALVAIRDRAGGPILAAAGSASLGGEASLALDRVLARFEPIRSWRVIGPFPRAAPQVFLGEPSIDFRRVHTGADGRPIGWSARQADPNSGRVDLDDLKRAPGHRGFAEYDAASSANLCAFAYAEVDSDRDGPALMLVGSSGTLIVTVNERIVSEFSSLGGRAYAPDSDRVRFHLARGRNRILVVSRQGVGRWGFGIQVARSSLGAGAEIARKPAAKLDDLRRVALRHEGDPRRGAQLFFEARGLGCARCHAAGGRGSSAIGPDLTGLASKYDRAELIRSVLEPSSRIATGYRPAIVAMRDGKVFTGVVRAETADWLELADSEAKVTRVARRDISERRLGDVSIMPELSPQSLSQTEFSDLISFLASLKGPSRPAPP